MTKPVLQASIQLTCSPVPAMGKGSDPVMALRPAPRDPVGRTPALQRLRQPRVVGPDGEPVPDRRPAIHTRERDPRPSHGTCARLPSDRIGQVPASGSGAHSIPGSTAYSALPSRMSGSPARLHGSSPRSRRKARRVREASANAADAAPVATCAHPHRVWPAAIASAIAASLGNRPARYGCHRIAVSSTRGVVRP